MKTLIFNGSPRPNGDTAAMISMLKTALEGEVKVIDAYRTDIRPCVDCRYCWSHPECAIADGMQALLAELAEADCIVIASPVYFSELTGPLLTLMSRLQILYTAGHFHALKLITKPKRGAVLLCGGGNGSPDTAEKTASLLLRVMHATVVGTVCAPMTDTLSVREDPDIPEKIRRLAEKMQKNGQ